MPVGEIRQRVSSSEMTEWAIYLRRKGEEMDKASQTAQAQVTPIRRR